MGTQTFRILQANLMRSTYRHVMAYEAAKAKNIDIIVLSEPNKRSNTNEWIKDKRHDAAAPIFLNKNLTICQFRADVGYVCLHIEDSTTYCCYTSPNIPLNTFRELVDKILKDCRSTGGEFIVLGDINVNRHRCGDHLFRTREGNFSWNE